MTKTYNTYIYFICNLHSEKGMQRIRKDRVKSTKCICKYCRHLGQTVEDLLKIPEINRDVEILSEDFKNVDTKIECKCKCCGHIWWITPAKLKAGKRCPMCKNKKIGDINRKKPETIAKELAINNPNIEFIGEYISANKKNKIQM